MRGKVEIFGRTESGMELILSDSNLIVDGAREHIADIMTWNSNAAAAGAYDVSNFTMAAISFGPSKYDIENRAIDTNFSSLSVTGTSNKFPQLPAPVDKTLQPSTSSINPLGQHINAIEFYASAIGIKNYSAATGSAIAVAYGSYAPGSAMLIPAGASALAGSSVTGVTNLVSVMDPDGFIYLNPCSVVPAASVDDSVSGLTVSADDVSATREIKYSISISKLEWDFLYNFYGGIDVIGLWVYDFYDNFKRVGVPFVQLGQGHADGSGGRYSTSLYNLDGVKYPKFKLFAKKTFFPDGLTVNPTYDGLTIIWSIVF